MGSKKNKSEDIAPARLGKAPAHLQLANNRVHVFVDDQNLFWGIVNEELGRAYRIDFGSLVESGKSGGFCPESLAGG
jgi:hypothetical protein